MTKDEALKLALEALEDFLSPLHTDLMLDINRVDQKTRLAITAIREALAQPVIDKSAAVRIATTLGWEPKRTWVGLSDEDLKLLSAEWRIVYGAWMDDFARDIEAKLKEKNT